MVKKVRIKDVAEHVGVSIALVSYVLNGRAEEKQVGKEIAEKIRQAAVDLNYAPNQIAKSLKTQRTHAIGLVVADINYRFSSGITRAIEAEAKRKNFTIIYGSSNESKSKFDEIVNVLVARQVDGLILVPVQHSEPTIQRLQKSAVPFILVDRNFPDITAPCISLNNYKAAFDSVSYLVKMGHRRIAFINYETALFNLHERDRGYYAALQAHGLSNDPRLVHKVGPAEPREDTIRAVTQLMTEKLCDAIFFATDRLAIVGLQQLNALGVIVPKDVSVFSFDAAEAFDLFYCPVTHASQPLEKMGKMAVNALIDILNKNADSANKSTGTANNQTIAANNHTIAANNQTITANNHTIAASNHSDNPNNHTNTSNKNPDTATRLPMPDQVFFETEFIPGRSCRE